MHRIILIPFWFLIAGLFNILPHSEVAWAHSSYGPAWSQEQGGTSTRAEPDQPVVRAVMFWMDTCGHCHYVLENVLPSLEAKYGEQFDLFLIQLVSVADADRLYRTAAEYGLSQDQVFVPFLVIGDQVLIGADQVEMQLPGLIDAHLAAGGLDFPQAAALADVLPGSPPGQTEPGPKTTPFATPGERIGLALANALLVGMPAAVLYTVIVLVRGWKKKARLRPVKRTKGPNPLPSSQRTREGKWGYGSLIIPILATIGLGVSAYLAFVETQAFPAVCGPLGDCNAVQSSPYARLLGVLPIGILGLIGYLAILAAWFITRFGRGQLARFAPLAILGMAFAGTLFSIYLTYLEPYVIEAVCAWCLTSAVVITLLLLVSLDRGREALKQFL